MGPGRHMGRRAVERAVFGEVDAIGIGVVAGPHPARHHRDRPSLQHRFSTEQTFLLRSSFLGRLPSPRPDEVGKGRPFQIRSVEHRDRAIENPAWASGRSISLSRLGGFRGCVRSCRARAAGAP